MTSLYKGHLISKCLFGVFNFSQKTNENMSTWGIILHSSKVEFFRSFLGELKIPKRHFEINWPLGRWSIMGKNLVNKVKERPLRLAPSVSCSVFTPLKMKLFSQGVCPGWLCLLPKQISKWYWVVKIGSIFITCYLARNSIKSGWGVVFVNFTECKRKNRIYYGIRYDHINF